MPESLEKIKDLVDDNMLEGFLSKWVEKQIVRHNYKDVLNRALDQTKLKAIVSILSRGNSHIFYLQHNFERSRKSILNLEAQL